MGWKVHGLIKKKLCHSNETCHAFRRRPGKLTKGFLFHQDWQDNAPAQKSVVAMAAVRDCCFELVDHPSYIFLIWNHLTIFCSPTWKKPLGWEAVLDRWWSHICSWGFFRGSGWELLYHGNPNAATQMEIVCAPQGVLCWKIKPHFGQIRP